MDTVATDRPVDLKAAAVLALDAWDEHRVEMMGWPSPVRMAMDDLRMAVLATTTSSQIVWHELPASAWAVTDGLNAARVWQVDVGLWALMIYRLVAKSFPLFHSAEAAKLAFAESLTAGAKEAKKAEPAPVRVHEWVDLDGYAELQTASGTVLASVRSVDPGWRVTVYDGGNYGRPHTAKTPSPTIDHAKHLAEKAVGL